MYGCGNRVHGVTPDNGISEIKKFRRKNVAKRRQFCEIFFNVKHKEVIIFPRRYGIFSANKYYWTNLYRQNVHFTEKRINSIFQNIENAARF